MSGEHAKKVAGIGELLWDILPQGKQMGGAPCNFAFHAMQAGFEAHVISSVGEDPDGREILQHMDDLGLGYSMLSKINPRLVMTAITGFGQTGPYRDFKAPDIVLWALSGNAYITGDSDRAPLAQVDLVEVDLEDPLLGVARVQ